MTNIPSELRISGHTVRVLLADRSDFGADDHCLGDCSTRNLQIRIDRSLPASLIGEVLLHEILEFLSGNAEIGLDHPQISQLSLLLYQVLSENKLVF